MIIRKIVIGDNPKDGLCFHVGQILSIWSNGDRHDHTISEIIRRKKDIFIYVKSSKSGSIFLWKEIPHIVPFVLEFNLNF